MTYVPAEETHSAVDRSFSSPPPPFFVCFVFVLFVCFGDAARLWTPCYRKRDYLGMGLLGLVEIWCC